MSQRKERRLRNMERRVASLEQRVDRITLEQVDHHIKIHGLKDDLSVYRAAVAEREKRELQRQTQEAKLRYIEKECARQRRTEKAVVVVLLLIGMAAVGLLGRWADTQTAKENCSTASPTSIVAVENISAEALGFPPYTLSLEEVEDPLENEKIEAALLKQGYFSRAIPLSFECQDYMRTYCTAYGCPYPLALAVAEVESNFDTNATGTAGEVGIMQLNPGPGGAYHTELQSLTGLDPNTVPGNIAGGCYKLGLYLAEYQDAAKAAMAYNMGRVGAMEAWSEGTASTPYSDAVLEAMEKWEGIVSTWNDQ